jgi:hypothetical protein
MSHDTCIQFYPAARAHDTKMVADEPRGRWRRHSPRLGNGAVMGSLSPGCSSVSLECSGNIGGKDSTRHIYQKQPCRGDNALSNPCKPSSWSRGCVLARTRKERNVCASPESFEVCADVAEIEAISESRDLVLRFTPSICAPSCKAGLIFFAKWSCTYIIVERILSWKRRRPSVCFHLGFLINKWPVFQRVVCRDWQAQTQP